MLKEKGKRRGSSLSLTAAPPDQTGSDVPCSPCPFFRCQPLVGPRSESVKLEQVFMDGQVLKTTLGGHSFAVDGGDLLPVAHVGRIVKNQGIRGNGLNELGYGLLKLSKLIFECGQTFCDALQISLGCRFFHPQRQRNKAVCADVGRGSLDAVNLTMD